MPESYRPFTTAELTFCGKGSSGTINGVLLPSALELPMQMAGSFRHQQTWPEPRRLKCRWERIKGSLGEGRGSSGAGGQTLGGNSMCQDPVPIFPAKCNLLLFLGLTPAK